MINIIEEKNDIKMEELVNIIKNDNINKNDNIIKNGSIIKNDKIHMKQQRPLSITIIVNYSTINII